MATPTAALALFGAPGRLTVKGSSRDVAAAMRALDNRLNGSMNAKRYNLLGNAPARAPGRVGFLEIRQPGAKLDLVPEDGPSVQPVVDYTRPPGLRNVPGQSVDTIIRMGVKPEDDAAAAYVMRSALVHGQGRLEPTGAGAGTKPGGVQSTWMTRAAKPVSF